VQFPTIFSGVDIKMIDELLKLSKIFKEGFTVELKNGKINQYKSYDKPFIVSYSTLIKVTDKAIEYINLKIPDNCIIGGWFNSDINTYYIELNMAFDTKEHALTVAEAFNQKAFYNLITGEVIAV